MDENDLLAEIVCAGEPLQAELLLPERGLALVRLGQPVKLLYDAFPYERYGVQYGDAALAQSGLDRRPWRRRVSRLRRPRRRDRRRAGAPARAVLPGMTGRAAIVVGRRSLASYAIEPVRQLRESLSADAATAAVAVRP